MMDDTDDSDLTPAAAAKRRRKQVNPARFATKPGSCECCTDGSSPSKHKHTHETKKRTGKKKKKETKKKDKVKKKVTPKKGGLKVKLGSGSSAAAQGQVVQESPAREWGQSSDEEILRRIFKCEMCSRSFSTYNGLRRHATTHSDTYLFECKDCNKRFKSREGFTDHKRTIHAASGRLTCEECGKPFSTRRKLLQHMNVHSDDKQWDCRFCNKKFKARDSLNTHLTIHTGEKLFSCEECQRSFRTSTELSLHRKWHKNELNYICAQCGKRFIQKCLLDQHMLVHSGERPYACELCDATFQLKREMTVHVYRVHEQRHPFICTFCSRGFYYRHLWKKHELAHQGIKNYTCDVCGKSFTLGRHLKFHQMIHTDVRPFPCHYCDRRFRKKWSLTVHLRNHHGIEEPKVIAKLTSGDTQLPSSSGVGGVGVKSMVRGTGGKTGLGGGGKKAGGGKRSQLMSFQCGECGERFSEPILLKAHEVIHGVSDSGSELDESSDLTEMIETTVETMMSTNEARGHGGQMGQIRGHANPDVVQEAVKSITSAAGTQTDTTEIQHGQLVEEGLIEGEILMEGTAEELGREGELMGVSVLTEGVDQSPGGFIVSSGGHEIMLHGQNTTTISDITTVTDPLSLNDRGISTVLVQIDKSEMEGGGVRQVEIPTHVEIEGNLVDYSSFHTLHGTAEALLQLPGGDQVAMEVVILDEQ